MHKYFKDDSKVKTSKEAFRTLLVQLGFLALFALSYILLIYASILLDNLLEDQLDSCRELIRWGTALLGTPLFITMLGSIANCFDLLYFCLTEKRINDSSTFLKAVRIIFIIIFFIAFSLSGVMILFYLTEGFSDREKSAVFKQEQVQHLEYLNKGRHVWNRYITQKPRHAIDLSYADLSGRDFTGYYFSTVKFEYAILKNTVFDDCCLRGAYFRKTDCRNASFKKAYFGDYAYFDDADLRGADFTGAYAKLSITDPARKNLNFLEYTKKKPTKLDNIEPPQNSRWHNVFWESFNTLEYLEQSGYIFDRKRAGKMLEELGESY